MNTIPLILLTSHFVCFCFYPCPCFFCCFVPLSNLSSLQIITEIPRKRSFKKGEDLGRRLLSYKNFQMAVVSLDVQYSTCDVVLFSAYSTYIACPCALFRDVLYCIVLYCIVLYCIVFYCILLYCIVFYFHFQCPHPLLHGVCACIY